MKQIKEILQNKLFTLEKLKLKVEKSLKKAPETEATLIVSSSHGNPQYYLREKDRPKQYISKNNLKFITPLAQKEYDQALQKEIMIQEKQIRKILKNLPKLQSFPQNDIILGKNFIATFESAKHPFDISALEIMLQELLS